MRSESYSLLVDFLVACFTSEELLRLLRRNRKFAVVIPLLPMSGSPLQLCSEVARILESKNLLDEEFFHILRLSIPNRTVEIDEIESSIAGKERRSIGSSSEQVEQPQILNILLLSVSIAILCGYLVDMYVGDLEAILLADSPVPSISNGDRNIRDGSEYVDRMSPVSGESIASDQSLSEEVRSTPSEQNTRSTQSATDCVDEDKCIVKRYSSTDCISQLKALGLEGDITCSRAVLYLISLDNKYYKLVLYRGAQPVFTKAYGSELACWQEAVGLL